MRTTRSDHRLRAIVAGILFVLAAIFPMTARADVEEMGRSMGYPGALDSVRKWNSALPSELPTDNDVFLVIHAGATYADAYLLGRFSADPVKLARALEKAVAGTPLGGRTVGYTRGGPHPRAGVRLRTNRLGLARAEMRLPVGLIISRLAKSGLRAHTVLEISSAAIPSSYARSWMRRNKTGTMMTGVVAPGRTDLELTLRAELDRWDTLRMILLVFSGTLIGLIAIPVVARTVATAGATPQGNAAVFAKRYRTVGWGIAFLNLYAMDAYVHRPWYPRVFDLWFGSDAGLLLLPLLIPLLLPLLSKPVSRRLFRVQTVGGDGERRRDCQE